jgi:hypothetical protein
MQRIVYWFIAFVYFLETAPPKCGLLRNADRFIREIITSNCFRTKFRLMKLPYFLKMTWQKIRNEAFADIRWPKHFDSVRHMSVCVYACIWSEPRFSGRPALHTELRWSVSQERNTDYRMTVWQLVQKPLEIQLGIDSFVCSSFTPLFYSLYHVYSFMSFCPFLANTVNCLIFVLQTAQFWIQSCHLRIDATSGFLKHVDLTSYYVWNIFSEADIH